MPPQPPLYAYLAHVELVEQLVHWSLLVPGLALLFAPLLSTRLVRSILARKLDRSSTRPPLLRTAGLALVVLAFFSDAMVYPLYLYRACAMAGMYTFDWQKKDSLETQLARTGDNSPLVEVVWFGGNAVSDYRTRFDTSRAPLGYQLRFSYYGPRWSKAASALLGAVRSGDLLCDVKTTGKDAEWPH